MHVYQNKFSLHFEIGPINVHHFKLRFVFKLVQCNSMKQENDRFGVI